MKKTFRLLAAIALSSLCLLSCKKDDESPTTNNFYQTRWEGSTSFSIGSGIERTTYTYSLQISFYKQDMALYSYVLTSALAPIPGSYTSDYKLKDSKTAICTVEGSDGSKYDETATLSSDGNTIIYHTKVITDDERSWTDITMTKMTRNE